MSDPTEANGTTAGAEATEAADGGSGLLLD